MNNRIMKPNVPTIMVALSVIPFSGHTSERFVKAKRRDWQPD